MTDFSQIKFQIGGVIEFIRPIPPATGDVFITVRYNGFIATSKGNHMAYTLSNSNMIVVQVDYVDAKGNPATVDGPVAWASSNEDIATVTVDASANTRAKIVPVGPLGTAQITATADADLGEGVRELITTLDLTVVGGEAIAGVINVVGDPQPIDPSPQAQARR